MYYYSLTSIKIQKCVKNFININICLCVTDSSQFNIMLELLGIFSWGCWNATGELLDCSGICSGCNDRWVTEEFLELIEYTKLSSPESFSCAPKSFWKLYCSCLNNIIFGKLYVSNNINICLCVTDSSQFNITGDFLGIFYWRCWNAAGELLKY